MRIPTSATLVPALLLVLAASASAQSTGSERITMSTTSGGPALTTEIHGTVSVAVDSLAMSAEQAWTYLPAVFEGLGFKVLNANFATKSITGQIDRSRRPFGGKGYASLLQCGDVAGVPIAARADITLTVITTVAGSGEELALMTTQVGALASPMSTGASQTRCTANGGIGDIIAKRLAKAKEGK